MEKIILEKAKEINRLPILYLIVPIILGVLVGVICKKIKLTKTIQQLVISIIVAIIYIGIIAFHYYVPGETITELSIILVIWNSILIFISNKTTLYFLNIKNRKF